MPRSRNFLLPFAGFLVCAIALVSYPSFFVRFPVTRDVPWANWLLFAVGLSLVGTGVVRAFRHPERYRGRIASPLLGVTSLAILAFFVFITEIAPRDLPGSSNAPEVGEKAPDFTLPDADGRPVSLSDLIGSDAGGEASGSWALLIFYRGHW